ncbi:VanZ family protein [Streptomyces cyaneofuscatus]|uniref:VanZ family protein n=1 Tax=Streptomyces cyaneofuscatus TaxID=66883 RepID=UPI00343027B7
MLSAIFRGHELFIALAVILSLAAGAGTYAVVRGKRELPLVWGLWGACTAATLALTMWSTGDGGGSAICTVNRDILEPFRHTQGQWNFCLLVPFGLLGVVATRRPGLVAGLSLLLPAAIETTQALAPIGRACDTSDFVANGAGGLAGTALGALVIVFRRGTPLSRETARKGLIATGIAMALMGAALYAFADLFVMNHTVAPPATPEQKAAIEQRLRDAFGGAYRATDYSVTTTGSEDAATVTAYFGNGMAELSWPDQWDFTVQVMSATDEPSGAFSVPGAAAGAAAAKRPVGDKDAVLIARAYADQFAPWGTRNAKVQVARTDDGLPGWLVSWRRYEGDVVLPHRFDVRIDEEGRVSELTERKVADPELPPVRVTEAEAWKTFEKSFHDRTDSIKEKPKPTLSAQFRDGEWRVDWLLVATTATGSLEAAVDATDGSIHDIVETSVTEHADES